MKPRALVAAAPLVLASLPCGAAEPGADTSTAEVERCVETHDRARVLMLEERWYEAREDMLRCEEPGCPLAIRSDCAAWSEEVTRVLPTLLVVVERDDDGQHAAELEIDGTKLELPNPPRPIELLPGRHRVRVRLAGYPEIERSLVLDKGEKNHVVRVAFVRERPVPPPPALRKQRATRPIPAATYVLAGGAVAAFATSGIFLASALASRDDALERCAPECGSDEADSIDARLLAADLFGAAGLVFGGFAVYTLVTRPTVLEATFVPKLELARDRARLSVEGRF